MKAKEKKQFTGKKKNIAVVAHDNMKNLLLEWAENHRKELEGHRIYATGTTGKLIEKVLGIDVKRFNSGPLGGDQQIGAKIAEGDIDFLIFFWDPLSPHPHDPDVKALLRLSVLWNIPTACNISTADYLINSKYFDGKYKREIPDYSDYDNRLDK